MAMLSDEEALKLAKNCARDAMQSLPPGGRFVGSEVFEVAEAAALAAIKSAASNAAEAERKAVVAYAKAFAKSLSGIHAVAPGFITTLAERISRGDHTPSAEGM